MSRSLILLSNDDGIGAPGLIALCEAMLPLGDVVVMAPDVERSAVGHAITLSDPLRVHQLDHFMDGITAYSSSGTPADCIKLAVLAILDRKPDLVVSGINHGSNTGVNVIYSGTVSAATEGTILGIPSAAISLNFWSEPDFEPSKAVARHVARGILKNGLPKGTLLNVNIPALHADELPKGTLDGKGYALTVHGKADWQDNFDKRVDPHERVYYWLTGRKRAINESPNTDEESMKAGRVSITPLQYDLTDYAFEKELAKWDLFKGE